MCIFFHLCEKKKCESKKRAFLVKQIQCYRLVYGVKIQQIKNGVALSVAKLTAAIRKEMSLIRKNAITSMKKKFHLCELVEKSTNFDIIFNVC